MTSFNKPSIKLTWTSRHVRQLVMTKVVLKLQWGFGMVRRASMKFDQKKSKIFKIAKVSSLTQATTTTSLGTIREQIIPTFTTVTTKQPQVTDNVAVGILPARIQETIPKPGNNDGGGGGDNEILDSHFISEVKLIEFHNDTENTEPYESQPELKFMKESTNQSILPKDQPIEAETTKFLENSIKNSEAEHPPKFQIVGSTESHHKVASANHCFGKSIRRHQEYNSNQLIRPTTALVVLHQQIFEMKRSLR